MNLSWIVQRGDWAGESANTAFEYLSSNPKSDRACGRVLAGWSDLSRGGHPPTLDDVEDEGTRDKLVSAMHYLFSFEMDLDMKSCFFSTLLLHHEKVKEDFPEHFLVVHLEEVLTNTFSLSIYEIVESCRNINDGFRRRNVEEIAIVDLDDTLKSGMERLSILIRETVSETGHLRQELAAIRASVAALQADMSLIKRFVLDGHCTSSSVGQLGHSSSSATQGTTAAAGHSKPAADACSGYKSILQCTPTIEGETIASGFAKWITYGPFNRNRQSGLNKSQRSVVKYLTNNFYLVKCLVPAAEQLADERKPEDEKHLPAWRKRIQREAEGYQRSILERIAGMMAAEATTPPTTAKNAKRRRLWHNNSLSVNIAKMRALITYEKAQATNTA